VTTGLAILQETFAVHTTSLPGLVSIAFFHISTASLKEVFQKSTTASIFFMNLSLKVTFAVLEETFLFLTCFTIVFLLSIIACFVALSIFVIQSTLVKGVSSAILCTSQTLV
jgi:hypothetical protein